MNDTPEFLSLVDMINALVEPPAPEPVSYVPQTWGWAVLAGLILAGLVWALRRYAVHRRANAYRLAALAALDRAATTADVARILRQTALAAYPRQDVASLIGESWITFLSRTGPAPFPAGQELTSGPYRAPKPPSPALRQAAADWIQRHERAT